MVVGAGFSVLVTAVVQVLPFMDVSMVYAVALATSQKILKRLMVRTAPRLTDSQRSGLLLSASVAQREALLVVSPSIALSAVKCVPLSKLLAVAVTPFCRARFTSSAAAGSTGRAHRSIASTSRAARLLRTCLFFIMHLFTFFISDLLQEKKKPLAYCPQGEDKMALHCGNCSMTKR